MRPFTTRTLAAGLATISLAAAPATLDPPGDILSFHAVAQATITDPPPADSLRVTCSRKVRPEESHLASTGWWSLLAPRGATGAAIAAFTRDAPVRPGEALSTTVRFAPMPTARVTRRSTLDWAWIWDRDGDGRADYVAYLQNAHPVLPHPVPADWKPPTVEQDGSVSGDLALFHAVIDHAAMIFRHYADDDFDGTVDAAVVEQFDDAWPMFVANAVVVRRARGTPRAGEAWAFRDRITDTLRVLTADSTGVIWIPAIVDTPGATPAVGGRRPAMAGRESADARLEHGTRVLGTINALAAHCGPEKGRIRVP